MRMKLLCIFLALLCAGIAEANIRTTIVQGEIPQKDASRPTYKLRLPDLGTEGTSALENAAAAEALRSTRVRMVSAQGQVLQCVVPSPPPLETGIPKSGSENAYDDVDYLLRGYDKKCFVREEGWWTFEFCYGKEVVQKHKPVDENDKEDRYVLGAFDREFDLARRKNVAAVARPGASFTQLYGNGTTCDVTGRAREILIKYICADDTMQMESIRQQTGELFLVKGIREVATCVYELDFISTAICEQNLYKTTARRNALEIKCELEKGQGVFRGLSTKRYRRASLTL